MACFVPENDDFTGSNGDSPNVHRWDVFFTGTGNGPLIFNNKLRHSVGAGEGTEGVNSRYIIPSGSALDVRINYTIVSGGDIGTQGWNAGIDVHDNADPINNFVRMSIDGHTTTLVGKSKLDGVLEDDFTPSIATSGSFRIVSTSGSAVFTTYYKDSGLWQSIHTRTLGASGYELGLYIENDINFPGCTLDFDTWRLTYDDIICGASSTSSSSSSSLSSSSSSSSSSSESSSSSSESSSSSSSSESSESSSSSSSSSVSSSSSISVSSSSSSVSSSSSSISTSSSSSSSSSSESSSSSVSSSSSSSLSSSSSSYFNVSRTHFWHYVVDQEGRPIQNAQIRFYLDEDPTIEATIFTTELAVSYTTTSAIELKTDSDGFFEFWLANEWEIGGYAHIQSFRLEWYRAGIAPGVVTDINPWPTAISWVDTNLGADKDHKNRFVSDFLANKWWTHTQDFVPSASPHNLQPVDVTKTCLTSSDKYNKVVSNKLLNDIWTFATAASTHALTWGGVNEYQTSITSWFNPSAGYYYKDITHTGIISKSVTVQISKLSDNRQIEPKKIINLDLSTTRIVITEDIDVEVNIQGGSSSSSTSTSSSSSTTLTGNITFVDRDDQGGGNYQGVWGDGNFIYAACTNSGLRSHSVDGGGILTHEDQVGPFGSDHIDVWGDGTFIYVACGSDGLRSYSVDGSGNLTLIDTDFQSGYYMGVWTDGTYIYVACDSAGLRSYSVDGGGILTHEDFNDQGGSYKRVWGDGTYIYVACTTSGLRSYSVDGGGNLTFIDTDDQGGTYEHVWGDGTYIYVACDTAGLRTYSVDGGGNLTHIDTDYQGDSYEAVWGDGNYIYVACGGAGIRSYSVDGGGNLTFIDIDVQGGFYSDVWGDGNFIYTGATFQGLLSYVVS